MRNRSLLQRPDSFILNYNHPLAQGLVFAGLGAHAGSTRYHDSSVFGNTGNLVNGPVYIFEQQLGRLSCQWGAATAYMATSDSSAFDVASHDLTVSAWWYCDWDTTSPMVAHKDEYNSSFGSATQWTFNADEASSAGDYGRRYLCFADTTTSAVYWSNDDRTLKWWHVGLTMGGGIAELYINGVSQGTKDISGISISAKSKKLVTNMRQYGSQGSSVYKCSDLLVYCVKKSTPEIQQLADPSNVMLSGLVLPPKRKLYGITYHPVTAASLFASVCITTKGIKAIRRAR